METNLQKFGKQGMLYKYDQLNRLTQSKSLAFSNGDYVSRKGNQKYDENYSYDANGNILTLTRRDDKANVMDDFNYSYYANSNKLQKHKTTGGIYEYDAIGNLVKDTNDSLTITWTPSGKVRSVTKPDTTIYFRYDAMGNRILKIVATPTKSDTTTYVRDASGNVMSIYKGKKVSEAPIYGSSRIGEYMGNEVEGCQTFNLRKYELSNHLGNVLAVISDKVKLYGHGERLDSARAEVVSMSDYYPFGLAMRGRQFNEKNYRYGFNRHEKDDEISGSGNHLSWGDYGMDTRIGRRWKIDPEWRKIAGQSPYSVNNNSPISFTDPDGEWAVWSHYRMTKKALIRSGIDRKTAIEIAYYASTYADNPKFLLRSIIKVVGILGGTNPARFSKNEKKYQNSEMSTSQGDDNPNVVRHAMRGFAEKITPEEAVHRALYGGMFTDSKGESTRVEGAINILKKYEGKDFDKLSQDDKQEIGLALHTVQDAIAHGGGRWVDEHEKDAKKSGDKKEHSMLRDIFGDKSEAKAATEEAIKILKGNDESKK